MVVRIFEDQHKKFVNAFKILLPLVKCPFIIKSGQIKKKKIVH